MTYLITFSCYGARVHGDESVTVDRRHNLCGSRVIDVDTKRADTERGNMRNAPYEMDSRSRGIVLDTVREVCVHRRWYLLAAHVRSSHVHIIVEGTAAPEKIMSDFKAYASRGLNQLGGDRRRRWARHGSTRWLWKDQNVRDAIRYVVEEQGEPMALFLGEVP
jgi:REP element-mobilizing transposase RayT